MWDETIEMADRLLQKGADDVSWSEYPVEHWERTRAKVKEENLHLVPHEGDLMAGHRQKKEEEDKPLISLED